MYSNKSVLLLAAVLIAGTIIFFETHQNAQGFNQIQVQATGKCMTLLPFDIWNNPQAEYYKWFGLQGKDIRGKNYLTGHAFQRHIAVNGACTLQQKQQNKTVFYNITEFQKAASQIPVTCDVDNHTSFTYDYNGNIASASNYIWGIDCTKGSKQQFPAYFVQFKRAINNSNPTQQQYLASNYVTIWTLYPKRS